MAFRDYAAAARRAAAAQNALDENYRAERAAWHAAGGGRGGMPESETYLRLNTEVNEAVSALPPGTRSVMALDLFRLLDGIGAIWRRRPGRT